ncbi:unnamed protein product [marine sediment metagenome]|uniref:Uncharacterized protein n=1 Tax=marine sediment metagenome TaxID=412755 RepID=X1D1V5_9ZZZZ
MNISKRSGFESIEGAFINDKSHLLKNAFLKSLEKIIKNRK